LLAIALNDGQSPVSRPNGTLSVANCAGTKCQIYDKVCVQTGQKQTALGPQMKPRSPFNKAKLTNHNFNFATQAHSTCANQRHQRSIKTQKFPPAAPQTPSFKGQFEVDQTLEPNEVAANLRSNGVQIATFF